MWDGDNEDEGAAPTNNHPFSSTGVETVKTAPARVRATLASLASALAEQRAASALAAVRGAPVDVQVAATLFEDAPQELRARLWTALLNDPTLRGPVSVKEAEAADAASAARALAARAVARAAGLCEAAEAAAADANPPSTSLAASDSWQVVQDAPWVPPGGGAPTLAAAAEADGESNNTNALPLAARSLRNRLMAAALASPYPPPTVYAEGSPYDAALLARPPPNEDGGVDDAVSRDLARTFPEHPQFAFASGKAALSRVLTAVAAADPTVGYVQGLAFVAGVALQFLPEPSSYSLVRRLLAPPSVGGCGLRGLYAPGLPLLRAALAAHDALLGDVAPEAAAVLTEAGVPAALYAAQWLLTSFAAPFPPAFAARMLDAVLIEGSINPLLRVSVAATKACEAKLMATPRGDFEAAVGVVKLVPAAWRRDEARAVITAGLSGETVSLAAVEAALAAAAAADDASARTPPACPSPRPPSPAEGGGVGSDGEGLASLALEGAAWLEDCAGQDERAAG